MQTSTFSDYGISVPMHASGRKRTTCPRCSDSRKKKTDPCLSVNISEGTWRCHNCCWTSGLPGYGKRKGYTPAYKKPEYVKPEPPAGKITHLPDSVIQQFLSRGIPEETLAKFEIGFGRHWYSAAKQELNGISFPFYFAGDVVNIKHRARFKDSSGETFKTFALEPGAEMVLYNIDGIQFNDDGDTTLIWTEGEIDVLSVDTVGYTNVVSVPNGAPQPEDRSVEGRFKWWESAYDIINSCERHIIAVDNDAPGRRLKDELVKRLGAERCWAVSWPVGCKDANEVLVNLGRDALIACIAQAKPIPVSGIFEVKDVRDRVLDFYDRGMPPGLHPGWESLSKHYTVKEGQWTLITGIPGHYKTAFLDAMSVHMATLHDWKIDFYSPENEPTERHISLLMSQYTGKPFKDGPRERMTKAEAEAALDWVDEHFSFIELDEELPTLEVILEKCLVQIRRRGTNGFVIDPWNEIDHSGGDSITEAQHISRSLSKIKRFAKKHNVHIWVVAHPKLMLGVRQEDGTTVYPIPTPYDVAGGANWRNKAFNCITLYRRDFESDEVEIHIQKVKFHEVGKPGMVTLKFDASCGRFKDPVYAFLSVKREEQMFFDGMVHDVAI